MAKISIVKPIKVRVGNLAGLRGVLNYIKADFKTKDGTLVFGKDCFPEKAFEQMAITKKAFNKDSGRQYAHFVQSFYRYDDLTPEQALEIGQKFMARYERFKDFQVCAAVHTNGPQLHIHYVVNSVSHVDGHKWQSSREDLKQMLAERKFQELLATQTRAIQERIAAEQAQSAILHSSIAGLFDQFEEWLWEKKCKEEMLNYEQQKTGDTKEAKIYEDDEYELY